MISYIISTVAVFSAITLNVQSVTVRQAASTDIGDLCGAITDKAECNVHEFCSYKDDQVECNKLNSWVEAINNPMCIAYTTAIECEADLLCNQGKNTLRCKGENDYLYLNENGTAVATGIVQPTGGEYVHTSKYCRTYLTEAECAAGPHFGTVCEWEEAEAAVPATATESAVEAKAAQCGNKKRTNEAANDLICRPDSVPLEAEACAEDMRCELGLVGSDESCKPSDQIIVLI
ncbi:hypothetical protein SARC_10153 [Sphaeroforma arctica JP610]|uniref:Dickkopf N-terminal cysteine-rich domain-containing protein n=1 Tax=Sphaeroforma arctica JP610 TaxID=667725 RepID=A0A0L0FLM6_9EUKA|nr:hypothetical protein SARC_10153 [Sphaeroforma arctica JP610]KNC77386.1 hypothetical protein SARC_10153 [Sphaeroforma arctica JP610]|eukprot:XP_014151288.1 hypothetical protein SARC_10153 [Sphaeroforma arctica JP610]